MPSKSFDENSDKNLIISWLGVESNHRHTAFKPPLYLNPEELLSYLNQMSYKDKKSFQTTKICKNFFFLSKYRVSFIAYKFRTDYKDKKLHYCIQIFLNCFSNFWNSQMYPIVFHDTRNNVYQIFFVFFERSDFVTNYYKFERIFHPIQSGFIYGKVSFKMSLFVNII